MIDGAGTHNYTYDTRDRLTAATHPNQTNESYILDDVGNRTASHQSSSYSYQGFNRLTAANGTTFGYDTNGNLTAKTDGSGSWTYTWDYENRLKQGSQADGVSVTTLTTRLADACKEAVMQAEQHNLLGSSIESRQIGAVAAALLISRHENLLL